MFLEERYSEMKVSGMAPPIIEVASPVGRPVSCTADIPRQYTYTNRAVHVFVPTIFAELCLSDHNGGRFQRRRNRKVQSSSVQ